MKNLTVVISLSGLLLVLSSFSTLRSIKPTVGADNTGLALYTSLRLGEKGLSRQAFDYAWKGYCKLLKKKLINQPGYLTICDFSQPSSKKRLYVIDLNIDSLVVQTYVAHGRNSGREYASRFSNKMRSLQSSLGFYVTMGTYQGEHGLSLRLKGLEPSFNSNALRRGIVIHGAPYIGEDKLQEGPMGRSFGCPAVPKHENEMLINLIKDGTCFFIYFPSRYYKTGSKILNG